jgi:hypothetical protein
MTRELKVKRLAKSFYWEKFLKKEFSVMKLEFIEIALIEELIPYEYYNGFVRIKSYSGNDEFIEVTVSFNMQGIPYVTCNPKIINTVHNFLDGGKILLDKISSKSSLDGIPGRSNQ